MTDSRGGSRVAGQDMGGVALAAHGLIDCHTHAWTAGLALEPARHYDPEGERPVEALLADMDRHVIARSVVVQPSFLADDNQYLMQILAQHPDRLRGVATFSQAPAVDRVRGLHAAGVRGLRLNLFGDSALPDPQQAGWGDALQAMRTAGWHIVVAGSGTALANALRVLATIGLPLVIDHFGMPSVPQVARCPGVRALADIRAGIPCWIKLSAPYRLRGVTEIDAVTALNRLGFASCYVWGSDAPFTRFEQEQSYPRVLAALHALTDAGLVSTASLADNAAKLYFGKQNAGAAAPA